MSNNKNLNATIEQLKKQLEASKKALDKYAPIADLDKALDEKQAQLKEILGAIESVEKANKIIEERDSIIKEATSHADELKKNEELLEQSIKELSEKYGAYESVEKMLADAKTKAEEITAQATSKANELEKTAKQEAAKLKSEAQAERTAADTEIKKQKKDAEEKASNIIKEAQASARNMTDEAESAVEAYYANKEAEGEARKQAIIKSANAERDNIIKLAKDSAESAAQSIRVAAENARTLAEEYAASVKEKADKLYSEAEENKTEEKEKAMEYRKREEQRARDDAEQIRQNARNEMKDERERLEKAKIQLEKDKYDVELKNAQADRREERLDEREQALDEEVDERVREEHADMFQKLEQTHSAFKNMKSRADELGQELKKYQDYKWSPQTVTLFNDFIYALKEKGLTPTKEFFAQILNAQANLETAQAEYAKLSKANDALRKQNGDLKVAQSNSNNLDAQLAQEKTNSEYFKAQAKNFLEELEKNKKTSRDDMLRPVRLAPEFLDKNLPDYKGDNELEWLESIRTKAESNGLYFTKRQLFAYHTAQKIRGMSPVVVLAGISGTGKSELPRNYALYGGMYFLSIPVKPDWDSPASLFGYYNSIEKRFEASELLRAIWQMKTDPSCNEHMLMVLLDEMNLAHPEQYFADILSKLETSRGNGEAQYDILLGGGESPEKIAIGSNILWTGTMNEDETTKGLSDKVIDRSTLITFPRPRTLRSRRTDSEAEKQKMEFVLPRATWNGWLSKKRRKGDEFEKTIDTYRGAVQDINGYMSNMGRNLGHRVWQGIEEYISNYPEVVYAKDDNELKQAMKTAFTDAVAFKIMPKLRGLETSGRNKKQLDEIETVLANNKLELEEDFKKAREMTTELFQWSSAEFMNKEQGKKE